MSICTLNYSLSKLLNLYTGHCFGQWAEEMKHTNCSAPEGSLIWLWWDNNWRYHLFMVWKAGWISTAGCCTGSSQAIDVNLGGLGSCEWKATPRALQTFCGPPQCYCCLCTDQRSYQQRKGRLLCPVGISHPQMWQEWYGSNPVWFQCSSRYNENGWYYSKTGCDGMGMCCEKKDTDWVKKCMVYEVQGSRPRGRPKRMWREVVQKDCQACNLNREDAMDHRGNMVIKTGWWSGWWVGECFFWYRLT